MFDTNTLFSSEVSQHKMILSCTHPLARILTFECLGRLKTTKVEQDRRCSGASPEPRPSHDKVGTHCTLNDACQLNIPLRRTTHRAPIFEGVTLILSL